MEKDRFHDISCNMGLVGAEGPSQATSAHFLLWSLGGQVSGKSSVRGDEAAVREVGPDSSPTMDAVPTGSTF